MAVCAISASPSFSGSSVLGNPSTGTGVNTLYPRVPISSLTPLEQSLYNFPESTTASYGGGYSYVANSPVTSVFGRI